MKNKDDMTVEFDLVDTVNNTEASVNDDKPEDVNNNIDESVVELVDESKEKVAKSVKNNKNTKKKNKKKNVKSTKNKKDIQNVETHEDEELEEDKTEEEKEYKELQDLSYHAQKWYAYLKYQKMDPHYFIQKYPRHKFRQFVEELFDLEEFSNNNENEQEKNI